MMTFLAPASRCLAASARAVRTLTATNSISAPAAWAARKTLRPMRPKPLMPTFTAMQSSLLNSFSGADSKESALVGPDGDLDLVPVGVLDERRVGAGAMRAPLARVADVDATRPHRPLPGRLDGDDPEPGEAEQPETRLGLVVSGDEEDRLGDSPADRFVLLEMAPPTERGEHRVVEL